MADRKLQILIEAVTRGEQKIDALGRRLDTMDAKQDRYDRTTKRAIATNDRFAGSFLKIAVLTGGASFLASQTKGVIAYGNEIAKASQKLGVGIENLQRFQFAVESNTTLSGGGASTALQRYTRRLGEAAKGKGELLGIVEEYNIQIRDSEGNTRRAMDVLNDFADVIQRAEDPQERLRIAFKLFDAEGAELVNILSEGRRGLENYMGAADRAGVVIQESSVKALEDLNQAFETIEKAARAQAAETVGGMATLATGTDTATAAAERLLKVLGAIKDGYNAEVFMIIQALQGNPISRDQALAELGVGKTNAGSQNNTDDPIVDAGSHDEFDVGAGQSNFEIAARGRLADISGDENDLDSDAKLFQDAWTGAFDAVEATGRETFSLLIGDTQYWTQQLGPIAGTLIGGIAESLGQLASQWITQQLLLAAIGESNLLASTALGVTSASTLAAATAPAAANATLMSFGANVPPALAGISATHALSKTLSSIGVLGAADGVVDLGGSGSTRSDNLPALLSVGETVLTAGATARNRETIDSIAAGETVGSGGQNYIFIVGSMGEARDKAADIDGPVTIRDMRKELNKFGSR